LFHNYSQFDAGLAVLEITTNLPTATTNDTTSTPKGEAKDNGTTGTDGKTKKKEWKKKNEASASPSLRPGQAGLPAESN
jgi:hypothetical protein